MKLLPSTVRVRVTVAAAAAVTVVLVAVGTALVLNHRRELTENLDEAMEQRADGLAGEVEGGVTPGLDSLGDDDWLAQLIAPDGAVLAASPTDDDDGVDDDVRVVTTRAEMPDGEEVVVRITAPTEDIDESVDTLIASLLVAVPMAAIVLAGLTWVIVGRTLRPVERIRSEVAGIGGSDLHRRVPVPPTDDEIGRLARTMNDMLQRVEEAHERQRRFVADASHELRSPLTRMRTELEVDLTHPATADPGETHRSVLDEVVGLQRLVDDLLMLARSGSVAAGHRGDPVAVGDVAERALHRVPPRDGVHYDVSVADGAATIGNYSELLRAIGNLVDNANRYARSTVRVDARAVDDSVVVSVEDDGPGVPAAERERVFERFARVDAARSAREGGAGLGLSIARGIVERHGGTIAVDPGYDEGARFVITLPAAASGS